MSITRTTRSLSTEAARAARRWYVADAEGKVLGRLASRVASMLRGKTNPGFSPHVEGGDFVVVVKAAKIRLTGEKLEKKEYVRHTTYPGGVRRARASEVLARHPIRLVRDAVVGMLPKNRLGRRLATKLKIYPGPDHPHQAQKPVPLPESRGEGDESRTSDRHLVHGQAEVLRRPRAPPAGGGRDRGEHAPARRVLRARDLAHDRAPAVRGHLDRGPVPHRRERAGGRRVGAGGGDPPRHHPRAAPGRPRPALAA